MKKILVISDPDFEANTAIPKAFEFQQKLKVQLHIVYFYQEDMRGLGSEGTEIRENLLARLEQKAKAQMASLQSEHSITYEVVWSEDLASWINDYAKAHSLMMVIKTGHRTEKFLYTPTDWQLIRTCPAPIMLLVNQKWQKAQHILASIDLKSTDSDKKQLNYQIIEQATDLSKLFNVDVHVAYVEQFSHVLRDLGIKSKTEVEENALAHYKVEIDNIIQTYGIDPDKFHIHAGNPDKVIPSLAAQYKASLVIIGSASKQGLRQKLVGNTAEGILKILKTDVLVLK